MEPANVRLSRSGAVQVGSTFNAVPWSQCLSKEAIAAVDRLDPEKLSQLLQIEGCADELKSDEARTSQLYAALHRKVQEAQQKGCLEQLSAVWQMVLSIVSVSPSEPKLLSSAQKLLCKVQKLDPVGAARMTLEATDRGLSPTTKTNVCTLMAAQSAARSFEDLELVSDLSKRLLDDGWLDLNDPSLVDRLNVFLACTCSPVPAHHRIGVAYPEERSISDVARRTQLGAQVGYAVVRAGVNFSEPSTAERIDMSIRGIASVGAALRLECALREGLLTEDAVQRMSKRLGLNFSWMAPDWRREEPSELYHMSEFLLLGAVDIARSCFVERDEGQHGVRVDVRYNLRGISLSNVILCLCKTELSCGDGRCLAVADLLAHALQVPYLANQVSKDAIYSALNWMDRDDEQPDIRGNAILTVLCHALPKIGDATLLEKMSARVLEYAGAVPEIWEICSSYLDAMAARHDELTKNRQKKGRSTWFSDLLEE